MRRRLIWFGVAVVAVALTAMVIPLALSARDVVQIQELGEMAARARAEAAAWEQAVRESGAAATPGPAAASLTYLLPGGGVVGEPPRPAAAAVVAGAGLGQTTTATADGWGYAASPAFVGDGQLGVVLVSQTPAQMREDLWPRLAAIAGVSAALLVLAALAAWRLAKQTAAPLTALADVAHQVADGDLSARAAPSTLREADQIGRALNRVTERVQELLAEERSATAELAHQLRTPLTVLSVDIDGVADPAVAERLRDDLGELQRQVDEIIVTARRPVREGLSARADAGAVVGDRIRFWAVLAEDQGRRLRSVVPADQPLWVRLTPEDLTTALDILLQNVFVHTPDGVPFSVAARRRADGMVEVEVADEGPGFAASNASGGPGSTGLGLSIAARLAAASGGRVAIADAEGGGCRVTLVLGPAPVA